MCGNGQNVSNRIILYPLMFYVGIFWIPALDDLMLRKLEMGEILAVRIHFAESVQIHEYGAFQKKKSSPFDSTRLGYSFALHAGFVFHPR